MSFLSSAKSLPLTDNNPTEENTTNRVVVKFNPRTDHTNTHRNVVDDNIYRITSWRIIKWKYFLAIIGYFFSLGTLFLLTCIKKTFIITLYCEESLPEKADFVVITDFSNRKYICSVFRQKYHEVHPIFRRVYNEEHGHKMNPMPPFSPFLNKHFEESDENFEDVVFFFKNVKYHLKGGEFCPIYFDLCKYTNEEILEIFNHINKNLVYLNSNESKNFAPNVAEYNYLLNKFGINELTSESKNIGIVFSHQFFNLLNLYSLLCVIIWIWTKYYIFSCIVLLFAICVLVYSTYTNYKISQKIYEIKKEPRKSEGNNEYELLIEHEMAFSRFIDRNISEYIPNINSSWSIVPGEVVNIRPKYRMEFDGLILNGYCTVDESELTGETNEVYKKQLPRNKENFRYYDTNHFLFQGTLIKECANDDDDNDEITVLVINTGMNTNRANLLLNLSFPKNGNYSFYKDIWIFFLVMLFIWVVGLIYIIVQKIYYLVAIDTLTIILPPTLYMSLSYNTHCYKKSLHLSNIECVDKDKITAAGKANIIVMDKTGTLTEDKFEIYGYQFTMPKTPNKQKGKIEDKTESIEASMNNGSNNIELSEVEISPKILNKIHRDFWKNFDLAQSKFYQEDPRYNLIYFTECLGCCHGIDKFGDKDLGDAIDKKIFGSVKWMIQIEEDRKTKELKRYVMPTNLYKITEKSFFNQLHRNIKLSKTLKEQRKNGMRTSTFDGDNRAQYKILIEKQYNFSSETQSVTVITQNLFDKTRRIYIKGAPEKILDKCINESKPPNINERIMELTKKGLRVIACSTRLLKLGEYSKVEINQEKEINPVEKEKNMIFLGLVIFKNPLKKDTQLVIQKLSEAKFKLVMSTGDNECTSYYVAQQSNMLASIMNTRYIIDIHKKTQSLFLKEQTVSIENDEDESLESFIYNDDNESHLDKIKDILKLKEAVVSVSGGALSHILSMVKNRKINFIDDTKTVTKRELITLLRRSAVIFFRMTPKNKAELIEFFKSDGVSIVIMCGDGSNDIPAILESDIGIALNQKSNLQILSHFYMNNSSIQCVETIVKTGRACFESNEMIFKFMILYGILKLVSYCCLKTLKISHFVIPQFFYCDFFCVLLPSIFASHSTPGLGLAQEAIGTSLLNKKFILSVLGQVIIQLSLFFGFFFYLMENVDYKIIKKNDNTTYLTIFGTYLFIFVSFQHLICNFVFNSQSVHRKHFSTNSLYILFEFLGSLISLLLVTINGFPNLFLANKIVLFEANTENFEYFLEKNKFVLQCFVFGDILVAWTLEKIISTKVK